MAARLASFNAPSTPNHSPSRPHATNTPSKATAQESTIHRRVRALLTEFRVAAATWDDLVLHDGFRSAKALVDARTELDNALALLPQGTLPRERIVTPKIILMDAKAQEIGARKQFNKMISVVDNLDAVVTEAHKQKGWLWIHTEPLWQTWTLEKFGASRRLTCNIIAYSSGTACAP
ncbi:hypothetical protein EXIGLDRAFT_682097 [Exidia glandulosa HHB12029]|uniref:Uncharacterized protein n=1 Tax=Exidia glandulosa HHB12029 TaxID=1314781 RepID=A0A165DQ71_EXIGL|nr:hypothetical protein EXIGLDRAFT_682097 [Exidia glandulosa HHB12029]